MSSRAIRDRGGAVRDTRIDAAVAVWVALWLLLGIWTAVEVWRLADLTTTVQESGLAIQSAGQALESFDPLPVVGDNAAELGAQVRANGVDIAADAEQARGTFKRLAVLLGFAVALVPSVPVALLRVVVRRTPLQA